MATVKAFILGGGGSGGARVGGGGGAGGVNYNATVAVVSQIYSVVVGGGGTAITTTAGVGTAGNDGNNSIFNGLTGYGGGGGGAYATPANGRNGGSGGGAGGYTAGTGGTASQGCAGGNGRNGGGGGGGGNTTVGAVGNGSNSGGIGGNGVTNNIGAGYGAANDDYAGGGGGSGDATGGVGGPGGGGAGSSGTNTPAGSGVANTGSGGGGARDAADSGGKVSGAGGSGIVIISYVTADFGVCSITGASNTQNVSGSNTICVFKESGNFIVSLTKIKKIMGIAIDNIRKVLGSINLLELYSTPLFGDASLAAYYRLEGNCNDSKNTYHSTGTNISYGTSYGKFGQGALFNGTSSTITTPFNNNLSLTDLSFSFWANTNMGNTGRIIGYEDATSGTNGLAIYFPNNTSPTFVMRNNNTSYDTNFGTVSTGVWHHYAISISSTVGLKLYIDGGEVGSNASATAYTSAGKILHIGSGGNPDSYYKGSIDDFAIFSKALSATEVLTLYKLQIKKISGVSNV